LFPSENEVKCVLSGRPGALGILLGFVPGAAGVGIILVAAEGALTTIAERGTAVGLVDCNEIEGVEPVGVGRRVFETTVPEVEVPEEGAGEGEEAGDTART